VGGRDSRWGLGCGIPSSNVRDLLDPSWSLTDRLEQAIHAGESEEWVVNR
jgi:hypothetical protein